MPRVFIVPLINTIYHFIKSFLDEKCLFLRNMKPLNKDISIEISNRYSDIRNRPVQSVVVEESTRLKWVKYCLENCYCFIYEMQWLL